MGAIADRGGVRKKMLIAFAYLGVLATASLFFVGKGQWAAAIFTYVTGTVGFAGANVFYDSLLPSIAPRNRIDRVSSLGFALGYLGGGLLFLVNVLMTLKPQFFGLADSIQAVRWAFVSVAVWWGGFTLFTLAWVPEPGVFRGPEPVKGAFRAGIYQLIGTFRKIRHLKMVALFLLAYWFYIDGVDTIIRMAVDYGLSLGFAAESLIVALLLVQFVGFPAALAFGRLGEKWGVRRSIYLAIGIYVLVTLWATQMTATWEFYAMAGAIGLVQGGIQALSRSYYARLIPDNQSGEYYGFYNMLGKFAAILGPALMGLFGLAARRILMPPDPTAAQVQAVAQLASRWSIASVILLFAIGALLFYFVDEEKGEAEAAMLARSGEVPPQ
jgi:UMF1 family MFS transporter